MELKGKAGKKSERTILRISENGEAIE